MTANVTDDLAAAYAARHEGQAATIAADNAVQRWHGQYIEKALRARITLGRDFTADDVRHHAARIANQADDDFAPADNLIPAFIGSAARHGRIREVGRVTSTRPERRGSKISLWRATSPAPAPTVSGRPPDDTPG